MRFFIPLLMSFLCIQNVSASSADTEKVREEATIFFERYLDAYNVYDPEAAAQNYAETVMVTGLDDTVRTLSRTDMKNLLARFLGRLEQNGVTRFEWETIQVRALSSRVAIASNVATRFMADGTVFNQASATLIAHKSEDKWQVVMLNLHPRENILPLG